MWKTPAQADADCMKRANVICLCCGSKRKLARAASLPAPAPCPRCNYLGWAPADVVARAV